MGNSQASSTQQQQRLINIPKSNKSNKRIEIDNANNQININSTMNNENGISQIGDDERDKYTEIKKSLKYMYKNNFVSATFDDLCAHYIQTAWKNYIIRKIIKNNHQGMIEIIYSSFNNKSVDKLETIEHLLNGLKLPFKEYDLMEYKMLKGVVNEFSDYDHLPIIFINDYYIGSIHDLQELIDFELLIPIVNKEYLNNCLNCQMIKIKLNDEEPLFCLHCMRPYTFFSKNNSLKNIWDNRNG